MPLFKEAQNLFGDAIFTYYFDIPFEATVMRHKQRHISSLGEEQMHPSGMRSTILSLSQKISFLVS